MKEYIIMNCLCRAKEQGVEEPGDRFGHFPKSFNPAYLKMKVWLSWHV
jgi:hypothetical protein